MFVMPVWLVITVGSLVVLFGLYRIRLAFRSLEADEVARQRGGIYGYSRRRQLLYGGVYILLGAMLLAGAFGLRMPWQTTPAEKNRGGTLPASTGSN